jgi:hypothetical protein
MTSLRMTLCLLLASWTLSPVRADGGRELLSLKKKGGTQSVTCVDWIEVNHYKTSYESEENIQLIFWVYSPGLGRYVCIAWETAKEQRPYRTPYGYVYVNMKQKNRLYIVEAKHCYETWTYYDAEMVNQEYLERTNRPGLRGK